MVKHTRTTQKKLGEQRGAYTSVTRSTKARKSTPEAEKSARERDLERAVDLLVLLHGPALRELAKY